MQHDPLSDLEDEGLLAKVAAGKLSMMVALCDHTTYNQRTFLGPGWGKIRTKWRMQEETCRDQLHVRLTKFSPDSSTIVNTVPIVTTRAMAIEGSMAAWGLGCFDDLGLTCGELQALLLCTGVTNMYAGMMRTLK